MARADPAPTAVEGGRSWTVGRAPLLVTVPDEGFEELRVENLAMCVGVVLEARHGNMLRAASALHFITPEWVANDKITEDGRKRLDQQLEDTRRHGVVTATLYLGDHKDARPTAKLISAHLQASGVVAISEAATSHQEVSYRLGREPTGNVTLK